MGMSMINFLEIRGLSKHERVDVNGLHLQSYIKKCMKTEAKLEKAYAIEEARMKEISELKNEIRKLKETNGYLLKAAKTNAKLIKENDELKYKLDLSNMFLERRKKRDALKSYKNISVDLRV